MFISNSSPVEENLSYMVVVYIGIILIIIAICILYIKIKAISEILISIINKIDINTDIICKKNNIINEKLETIHKNSNVYDIILKVYSRLNNIDYSINSTIDKAITKSMNENKAEISSNNNKPANTLTSKQKTFRKLKTAKK